MSVPNTENFTFEQWSELLGFGSDPRKAICSMTLHSPVGDSHEVYFGVGIPIAFNPLKAIRVVEYTGQLQEPSLRE